MAQPKNTLARILVPLVAILIGLGVFAAVIVNTRNQKPPAPVTVGGPAGATGTNAIAGAPALTGAATAQGAPTGPTGTTGGSAAKPPEPPAAGSSALEGLRALPVE